MSDQDSFTQLMTLLTFLVQLLCLCDMGVTAMEAPNFTPLTFDHRQPPHQRFTAPLRHELSDSLSSAALHALPLGWSPLKQSLPLG